MSIEGLLGTQVCEEHGLGPSLPPGTCQLRDRGQGSSHRCGSQGSEDARVPPPACAEHCQGLGAGSTPAFSAHEGCTQVHAGTRERCTRGLHSDPWMVCPRSVLGPLAHLGALLPRAPASGQCCLPVAGLSGCLLHSCAQPGPGRACSSSGMVGRAPRWSARQECPLPSSVQESFHKVQGFL